ncbi:MAG: hypothetical protein Q4F69_11845 [Bacteroidia bacterium]|nr:hypothetical protein [Bacteroidia bacterium]
MEIFKSVILALMVLFLTQCKKINQPEVLESGKMIDVALNVTSDGSKTDITPDRIVKWNIGDRIYVVGANEDPANCVLGYLTAENEGTNAYFTGSIKKTTITQKYHYYYVSGNEFIPDNNGSYTYRISSQNGNLCFADNGIAKNLHLMHGISKTDIVGGTTDLGNVTMESLMAIANIRFDVYPADVALSNEITCKGAFSSAELDVRTGLFSAKADGDISLTNVTENNNYYMALIPGTQIVRFEQANSSVTLDSKEIYANTFYNSSEAKPVTLCLNGLLSGEFSVSGDRKVQFSKGNLWCKTDSDPVVWDFEANQYDSRCNSIYHLDIAVINGTETKTPSKTVGSLKFSETAAVAYTHPYEDDGAAADDVLFTNDQTNPNQPNSGFTVCGVNNMYRTLTNDEWLYLMKREEYSKFGFASINISGGHVVNGLVILPDSYAIPEDCSFISGKDNNWNTNQYTTEQWGKMEDAGAVFLPAAGYSDYNHLQYNESGNYMTCNGFEWYEAEGIACYTYKYVHICTQDHTSTEPTQNHGLLFTTNVRISGISIRLVKDVVNPLAE